LHPIPHQPSRLKKLENGMTERRKRALHPSLARARRRMGAFVFRHGLDKLSMVGQLHPRALVTSRQVVVEKNVRYAPGDGAAHLLDVYRPKVPPEGALRSVSGALPVVLYVHGGAFSILSKDSHWMMGRLFARAGYVVFNVNYRLAPANPYPAALEDVAAAYAWVVDNAARFGGDPSRIVLAGESAGANLATAIAVCSAYLRDEPFAQRVFSQPTQPRAVIAACGILQVSDCARFLRRRKLSTWLGDRILEIEHSYFPERVRPPRPGPTLADPLRVLEDKAPTRPLPPFFAFVGTRDPLIDDTRRLRAALQHHGTACEMRIYGGGLHAFHAVYWDELAKLAWDDQLRFLARVLAS
jgi:acetyl esterase